MVQKLVWKLSSIIIQHNDQALQKKIAKQIVLKICLKNV